MESQPQNPEFRNNPENLHPYDSTFQNICKNQKATLAIKNGRLSAIIIGIYKKKGFYEEN